MRVVWLGWEEIYTTRRVQEAAKTQGLDLDAFSITINGLSSAVSNTTSTTQPKVTSLSSATGTSTLTLSGVNTYTGANLVQAGTLTCSVTSGTSPSSTARSARR